MVAVNIKSIGYVRGVGQTRATFLIDNTPTFVDIESRFVPELLAMKKECSRCEFGLLEKTIEGKVVGYRLDFVRTMKLKPFFFTCGQKHSHRTPGGSTWDKDSVLLVNAYSEDEARDKVFDLFGDKWCTAYTEAQYNNKYYPHGVCEVITV